MGGRILVVVDGQLACTALVPALQSLRHDVAVAEPAKALAEAEIVRPDVAMLEWDGDTSPSRHVASRLREASNLGILFLGGAGTADDLRSIYQAGADHYFPAPVEVDHVCATAGALLRRLSPTPPVTRIDGLVVDEGRGCVTVDGHGAPLTRTEMRLLIALVRNRGRTVSKTELMVEAWGYSYDPHLVEVHMSRLRTKLGPGRVKTVRGMGYVVG